MKSNKRQLHPLRLARLTQGLRQWDLALRSKVSQGRLSLIENGLVKKIDDKTKVRIARALGASVDALFS